MSAEVADVLHDAAELLRRDGWCQGTTYDVGTGERCALGAIESAYRLDPEDVYRAYRALVGMVGVPLTEWNDTAGRTLDEVLDAFARAEAAERAGVES